MRKKSRTSSTNPLSRALSFVAIPVNSLGVFADESLLEHHDPTQLTTYPGRRIPTRLYRALLHGSSRGDAERGRIDQPQPASLDP